MSQNEKETLYYLCPYCLGTNVIERFGEGADYLHCNDCKMDFRQQPQLPKEGIEELRKKKLEERKTPQKITNKKKTRKERIWQFIAVLIIFAFAVLVIALIITNLH